jgi:hypothetical protein
MWQICPQPAKDLVSIDAQMYDGRLDRTILERTNEIQPVFDVDGEQSQVSRSDAALHSACLDFLRRFPHSDSDYFET